MELLKIKTEQFEGPLDLLLFLIQKNELDISGISIQKITDQYVQTIELMRELNFDVASEFLVMASTLIFLKSKRLLPQDEQAREGADAEDYIPSEEELVRRLKEHKRFQEAGEKIANLPMLDRDFFARPGVLPPEKQTIWKEMDLTALTLVFQDVLKRSRKRSKIIIREPTSIPERIVQIGKVLKVGEMTEFAGLLSQEPDRTEVIVTFIALLEIARLKKLKIYQNETFGTIYLTLSSPLDELDPTLMTGFQYQARKIEEMAVHG
jgi:segregation and condensation protein A